MYQWAHPRNGTILGNEKGRANDIHTMRMNLKVIMQSVRNPDEGERQYTIPLI